MQCAQTSFLEGLTICRNSGLEKINQFNESLNNNPRSKKMNTKPPLKLNFKKKNAQKCSSRGGL